MAPSHTKVILELFMFNHVIFDENVGLFLKRKITYLFWNIKLYIMVIVYFYVTVRLTCNLY
jgi:hypothetical protein